MTAQGKCLLWLIVRRTSSLKQPLQLVHCLILHFDLEKQLDASRPSYSLILVFHCSDKDEPKKRIRAQTDNIFTNVVIGHGIL